MTLEVAVCSPEPLAVSVVVPAATPVSWPVLDQVLSEAMVRVSGTVATPGALLVILAIIVLEAVWLPE